MKIIIAAREGPKVIDLETRKSRLAIAILVGSLGLGSGLLGVALALTLRPAVSAPSVSPYTVAIVIGATLATFFIMYESLRLTKSSAPKRSTIVEDSSQRRLAAELTDIKQQVVRALAEVEATKRTQLEAVAGNREELIASIKPTLLSDISEEITASLAESAVDHSILLQVDAALQDAKDTIVVELSSLAKRSRFNLAIGGTATVFSIALLMYMTLWSTPSATDVASLLSHYVPRIGVVIFIEVFAFFFLKLYRSTLQEIRRYQEDYAAIAVRQVAFGLAWSTGDKKDRIVLAKELVAAPSARIDVPNGKEPEAMVSPKTVSELTVALVKALSGK